MASNMFRLGHLAITRAVCNRCGHALPLQLKRHVGHQGLNLMPTYSAVSRHMTVNSFTTNVTTGGANEEPDDLFRHVTVEIKTHDKAVMKSYSHFVTMAAHELGLNLANVFIPRHVIKRYSLLKSVHIYSKHYVQYETQTHSTVFELKHLTGSTADTFLEYIQRNLPEGMAMKVTKCRLEKIPDRLKPPSHPPSSTAEVLPSS